MPARYAIDKQRRLVILTAWDRLEFSDLRALQEQVSRDPDFNPDFSMLGDLAAVTEFALTVDETKTIAGRSAFSATSRRALVASQPAVLGMAAMLQAYREVFGVQDEGQGVVFYDRGAALKFLGITEGS